MILPLAQMQEASRATVAAALKARRIKSLLSPVVSIVVAFCVAFVLWRGAGLCVLGHTALLDWHRRVGPDPFGHVPVGGPLFERSLGSGCGDLLYGRSHWHRGRIALGGLFGSRHWLA
mgnify:CR=1 FL=1